MKQLQYFVKKSYMAQGSSMKVYVSSMACVYLSLILLAIPLRWVFAWVFAAGFHELLHVIALWLYGIKIEHIEIGLYGAKIQTLDLAPDQMVICALAGPLGGVLLLSLWRYFPRLALCALAQTLFNLVPILPLDGGQALQGLLRLILPERWVNTANKAIEFILFTALTAVSILAIVTWKLGILPLLLTTALAIHRKNRKIPCKWGALKVQ